MDDRTRIIRPPDRYLRQEPRVTQTTRMGRVEQRILEDRTWWQDNGAEVREWAEMCLVRVCVGCALLALLALAELLGPVAYLECQAANTEQEIYCEYRIGPRG